MTGLERLRAALTQPDGPGGVSISFGPDPSADGVVGEIQPGQARFTEVLNPFGLAQRDGIDLAAELRADPTQGESRLNDYASRCRTDLLRALAYAADGILYRLEGAHPAATTPMVYGGHFLEVDRELLTEIYPQTLVVVDVAGEQEPYLDFVGDLPAHAMTWEAADVDVESVRKMIRGRIDLRLIRTTHPTEIHV